MKRTRYGEEGETESVNTANVLMLLSRGDQETDHSRESSPSRVFECKTCNRQFPSFQALGGHRASHKKPKVEQGPGAVAKTRVHECSICGLEFAVGQALGGHMRRHRAATEGMRHEVVGKKGGDSDGRRVMCLDLNLPPLEEDDIMGFGLQIVDKTPMVGCLY